MGFYYESEEQPNIRPELTKEIVEREILISNLFSAYKAGIEFMTNVRVHEGALQLGFTKFLKSSGL